MKKFFYIAIIVILGSFAVTSCTEESVKPTDLEDTRGARGSIDPLKD